MFAQLAEELRRTGETREAVRVARAGLALHPSYSSARLTLGRALLDSGDPGAARAELEETVRQAGDNILARRLLARAFEAQGETAGALEQYRAILAMAPDDAALLAQVALLQQRLAAASRVEARPRAPGGSQAVAAASQPEAPESGSQAAGPPQREPAAAGHREEPVSGAAEADGPPPFWSSTLAELYLRQGFLDRAVEVYRRVVAAEPRNERARQRLAEIEGGAVRAEPGGLGVARRRELERTIGGLEALLGAVRRR